MENSRRTPYLKVGTFVQGRWRTKDGDLPFEQVLVDQLHGEALDGLLLQRLELHGERSNRRGGRLRGGHFVE